MTTDDPRGALLAEADVCLMFARLLNPPDEEGLELLATMAGEADALATLVCDTEGDAGALARGLDGLARVAADCGAEAIRTEQARLHEGAVRCPVNETAYVRRDKGHILADVAGFYRAFALEHDTSLGEKLDHVATELEFVALLLVLEAQAVERGLDEDRQTTRDALAAFVGDHLGCFLPGFAEALAREARLPFHVRLADLLDAFWAAFCARRSLVVEVAPSWQDSVEGESRFECGACPEPPAD